MNSWFKNEDGSMKTSTIYMILGIIIIFLVGGIGFIGYKMININNTLSGYEKQLANANSQINKLTVDNGNLAIELAKAQKDYMEMKSDTHSTTQVAYVEKQSANDADVEVTKSVPKVRVTAGDGTNYDFTPDVNTSKTIKDGKLVVTEDSSLNLDIEKIVDARFKDKVTAITAKHDVELKAKDEQIDKLNRKLSITKKQRDLYACTTIGAVGTGLGLWVTKKI